MPRLKEIETPVDPDGRYSDEALERAAAGDIAMLDDPAFMGYKWSVWRRRLDDEIARESQGGEWEFVSMKFGPIDEEWARTTLGGGTFDLRGYFDTGDGNGKRMRRRSVVTLAGPRKNFAVQPAPPLPGPPIEASDNRIFRALMRQNREILAALKQPTPAPAPAPTSSIAELVAALEGLHRMSAVKEPKESNPIEVAKMVLDGFHQGVSIGQEREPLQVRDGDDPNYMPVVKQGLEILDRILASRRPNPRAPWPPNSPPPAPPAQPGTAGTTPAPTTFTVPESRAEVVDDRGIDDVKPAEGIGKEVPQHRYATAVEALYRAMLAGRDPADFASSLEDMLNPGEVAIIASGTASEVLGFLGAYVNGFPQLSSEQGKVYLDSVLAELRSDETAGSPSEEDGA